MNGAGVSADADLAHRVARLEDRFALQDLVAHYALAVDDRDWDAIAGMYAADSVFDSVMGRIEGRDAVVTYYRHRTEQFGATYHYPHTQTLDFTGPDEAEGVVAAHAELAIGAETVVIALRYTDRYVREDGVWRFRERVVGQLYAMPLLDLAAGGLAQTDRKRWPGTDPAPAELPLLARLPH